MLANFVDVLGGLVVSPRDTFRVLLAEGRLLGWSLAVFLLVSITKAIAVGLVVGSAAGFIPLVGMWVPYAVAPALVLMDLAWLAVASLVAHLIVRAVDGAGGLEHTVSALAYSYLPNFLVAAVVGLGGPSIATLLLLGPTLLASFAWSMALAVMGMSTFHAVSGAKALIAVVFPYAFVGIAALAFMALATAVA